MKTNSRRTTVNGISYDSQLEASIHQANPELVYHPETFLYLPDRSRRKYLVLRPCITNSQELTALKQLTHKRYTPDFYHEATDTYYEVKGVLTRPDATKLLTVRKDKLLQLNLTMVIPGKEHLLSTTTNMSKELVPGGTYTSQEDLTKAKQWTGVDLLNWCRVHQFPCQVVVPSLSARLVHVVA